MPVWSALGLQWADIDEKPGLVYIRRSLTPDGSLCNIHESKRAQGRRTLAVTSYLLEWLSELAINKNWND